MDDNGGATEPAAEQPLSSSVLVLNRYYAAVRVVSARRAFSLLFKSFAEAIDASDGRFDAFDFRSWVDYSQARRGAPADHEQFVATPRFVILVPRVIRLMTYDKVPRREVKFSRRNIMARDENRCQYCAKRFSASQLSIDHVVPKSRGGKSTWTNVVVACTRCNTKKGGRMPWEASMKLGRPPAVPKKNPVLADKVGNGKYRLWRQFLGEAEMAIEA